jgi:hypothetical protein
LFLIAILTGMYTLYICFSEDNIQTRLYFLCLYQRTWFCACGLFVGLYWVCSPESILGSCHSPHKWSNKVSICTKI